MRLEELISQDYQLIGNGRYIRGVEHSSLVVDIERQIFFWNSRGIVGDALRWLIDIRGMKYADAIKIAKRENGNLFHNSTVQNKTQSNVVNETLVEAFFEFGKKHREYWYDIRGYTDRTVEHFRLGYAGEGWYTIPIFVDGVFRNFQCRNEAKIIRPWYEGEGALPFNFGILAVTDWVVLTEGPVDAIMLRQNDIPAVSQTAGAGDRNVYRKHFVKFKNIKRVYICYDNDKAGNDDSIEVAKLFGERAKIYNMWAFDEKFDVSDFFMGGWTKEQFLTLIREDGKLYYELG